MMDKPETKNWHALYVRSRSEKKVAAQLQNAGIETYLPLITRLKQWSDRKKRVEEPLFRSYVFVHVSSKEFFQALQVFGVLKFVTFEQQPAKIPDNQILAIKRYIADSDEDVLPIGNDLHEGQLVRITSGPLMGLTGTLAEKKGKRRLVVLIESVGQYVPINISYMKVEPVKDF